MSEVKVGGVYSLTGVINFFPTQVLVVGLDQEKVPDIFVLPVYLEEPKGQIYNGFNIGGKQYYLTPLLQTLSSNLLRKDRKVGGALALLCEVPSTYLNGTITKLRDRISHRPLGTPKKRDD